MALDMATSRDVLAEMRRTRRSRRVADVDWIDALYKAYLTALAAVVVVAVLSGIASSGRVTAAQAHRVAIDGPALLGLAAAIALAVALRSGERGGPLALEAADVRHVLLAPVPRAAALRPVALRQLRHAVFVGAVIGAVAGQLAFRRLPGSPAGWIVAGAAFGVAVGVGALGAAMVVSGRRVHRPIGSLVGGALLAWSVADVTLGSTTSPLSLVGQLAVAPLRFHPLDVLPALALLAVAAVGFVSVGGTSVEAAERRAALVGQLRFAVTLQDLRTVLLLRRQLAQETPRRRPWFRVSRGPRVWVRDWRGVARWPITRAARGVVLAAIAGLAARGAWDGTTPLVVVAGLALYVVALDTVEPLGQDLDHPDRAASVPIETGSLHLRHLPAAMVLTGLLSVAGIAVVAAVGPDRPLALALGVIVAVPAAAAAVAGAAGSAISSDPTGSGSDYAAFLPPEATASFAALRLAWPPGLAVVGVLPVLAARAAFDAGDSPYAAAVAAGVGVLLLVGFVAAWVRFRDAARAWIAETFSVTSEGTA